MTDIETIYTTAAGSGGVASGLIYMLFKFWRKAESYSNELEQKLISTKEEYETKITELRETKCELRIENAVFKDREERK